MSLIADDSDDALDSGMEDDDETMTDAGSTSDDDASSDAESAHEPDVVLRDQQEQQFEDAAVVANEEGKKTFIIPFCKTLTLLNHRTRSPAW